MGRETRRKEVKGPPSLALIKSFFRKRDEDKKKEGGEGRGGRKHSRGEGKSRGRFQDNYRVLPKWGTASKSVKVTSLDRPKAQRILCGNVCRLAS